MLRERPSWNTNETARRMRVLAIFILTICVALALVTRDWPMVVFYVLFAAVLWYQPLPEDPAPSLARRALPWVAIVMMWAITLWRLRHRGG